jgi:hypothetical protein
MNENLTQLSAKQMRFIGFMLVATQVIFLLVVLYLTSMETEEASKNEAFAMIVPGMALVVVPAAYFLFRKLIEQAKAQPTIANRLGRYRAAVLVKLAMLEGILLFTGVAILVTHHYWLLGIWAIVFLLMFTSFVSAVKPSFVEEIAQGDPRLTV